jgi:hypothetical protein
MISVFARSKTVFKLPRSEIITNKPVMWQCDQMHLLKLCRSELVSNHTSRLGGSWLESRLKYRLVLVFFRGFT